MYEGVAVSQDIDGVPILDALHRTQPLPQVAVVALQPVAQVIG